MVYVVFPVHNKLNSTKRFIKCIFQQTYQDIKIVICDDGSTDGTAEYITKNHPNIILLKGSGNLWWTAGINLCVRYVLENCESNDYLLTINNDVEVNREYIEQKVQRAKEFPDSIIGSICVFKDHPDLIETSGHVMNFKKCTFTSLTKFGERRKHNLSGIREATHLPGKGVLFPVKVFKKIGLYDSEKLPQYHADSDFTLRAFKAAFPILVDFDSVVFSDINMENLGYCDGIITLKGFINTFKGKYSINNFSIRRNFAIKHFQNNYMKYLIKTYFRIIGNFTIRYFRAIPKRILNG